MLAAILATLGNIPAPPPPPPKIVRYDGYRRQEAMRQAGMQFLEQDDADIIAIMQAITRKQ
jgi:hypothetical protein